MKYIMDFRFDNGDGLILECDRYTVSGNCVFMENKKENTGVVLRADEKYETVKFVSLSHLLHCDIKELEYA